MLSEAEGLVEYIASDETLDSYREIIRASGWRFSRFEKNAPFLDSHNNERIGDVLGRVVDFGVQGKRLIETVKWAIDVPSNQMARIGFEMTKAGYLRAVSVGFIPLRVVSPFNEQTVFMQQLTELGLDAQANVRAIYLEQEQVELSAVVIGANPNALARGYKAGILDDAALDQISQERTKRENAALADGPDAAAAARHRARQAFLEKFEALVKGF